MGHCIPGWHFALRNAHLLNLRACRSRETVLWYGTVQLPFTAWSLVCPPVSASRSVPENTQLHPKFPNTFTSQVARAGALSYERSRTSSPDAVLWLVTKLHKVCQESDVSFDLNLPLM